MNNLKQVKGPKKSKCGKYELKEHTGFLGNDLLFTIFKDASETEAKILFYLTKFDRKIVKIDDKIGLYRFRINVSELANYTNLEYSSIYRASEHIGKLQIKSIHQKGKKKFKRFTQMITEVDIYNGEIELEMKVEVFEELNKTIGSFTPIYELDKLMKLKSVNSIKMFALLNYTDNISEPYRQQTSFNSLEELNAFFGVNYEKMKHIKEKIINKIEKDLEGIIPFDYRPILDETKKGRGKKPIIGYTFSQKPSNLFTSKDLKDDDLDNYMNSLEPEPEEDIEERRINRENDGSSELRKSFQDLVK